MDIHSATEEAYKKGYEDGKRDIAVNLREMLSELLKDNAQCSGVLGIESCDTCPYQYHEDCYTVNLVEHIVNNITL